MDQNEAAAAAAEAQRAAHDALLESLTPMEAVLLYGAGITRFLADVMQAMQQRLEHPNGCYRAAGSILTLDGSPTELELYAVKVPVFALQEFAMAHNRARESVEGVALSAKIEAFRPPKQG